MILHIYIEGTQRFCTDVEPGSVRRVLEHIDEMMPQIAEKGRVTVALDSDAHKNVTYLMNRR